MKKSLLVIALFLFVSSYAQSGKDDLNTINKTLDNYFQGYVERDLGKLRSAFDTENGTMKLPVKSEDNQGFKNGYFKDIVQNWASKPPMKPEDKAISWIKVLSMDIISDKLASAKVEFKVGNALFIDLLTLQKISGQWKITNKSFIKL